MGELLIQAEKLNFSYRRNEPLIKNLNLSVPQKSIYGFLGPNGAGKSTTIRLITGLMKLHSGRVKLFGENLNRNNFSIFNKIGTMIEEPSLYFHLTAKENLLVYANIRAINKSRVQEILKIVNLLHAENKKVKEFSTGMKQRLGIGIALLADPELLILDEPTNGLDPQGMLEIRHLLQKLNNDFEKTIFVSSHLLSEVERLSTHVGIINKGEIVFSGTVEELKAGRSGKQILQIDLDDSSNAQTILNSANFNIKEKTNGSLFLNIETKEDVTRIIDKLRSKNISIYQVILKSENLEDLFFELTGGNND